MCTKEQFQQVGKYLGLSDIELLEKAYHHKYGVDCLLQPDLVALHIHGIVPDYAKQYENLFLSRMSHSYD